MMDKQHGRIGKVARRHINGKHSKTCAYYDQNYKYFMCRYSWQPTGTSEISYYLGTPFSNNFGHPFKQVGIPLALIND